MSQEKIENPEILKAINAFSQNKFHEAEIICKKILNKDNNPDANHILGCIRMGERKFDESISLIEKSLQVTPNNVGVLISLGCAQSSKKDFNKAITTYNKIITIKNDISQVHFYLGEAYRQTQQFNDSLSSFKRCLELAPDHIGCQLMIGIIYEELREFDTAIDFYKSCIDTYPEYTEPHINLGMCYLLTGNYEDGWHEYEWRLKLPMKTYQLKLDEKKKWTGQDLAGKKVLVVAEQSIGETFQFIRFAKQLAMDGATVTVLSQDKTLEILKEQSWIDCVLKYDDELPEYDFYSYIISIAKVLEWSPSMDTQKHPYLSLNDNKLTKDNNKKRLGFLIDPDSKLATYNQMDVPKVRFMELFCSSGYEIVNLSDFTDYLELAKTIQNLDMVITIEGDVVHLAGSLNIPTLLILPPVPRHTWDLNYLDSTPWYPSVELLRQGKISDWTSIVDYINQRIFHV